MLFFWLLSLPCPFTYPSLCFSSVFVLSYFSVFLCSSLFLLHFLPPALMFSFLLSPHLTSCLFLAFLCPFSSILPCAILLATFFGLPFYLSFTLFLSCFFLSYISVSLCPSLFLLHFLPPAFMFSFPLFPPLTFCLFLAFLCFLSSFLVHPVLCYSIGYFLWPSLLPIIHFVFLLFFVLSYFSLFLCSYLFLLHFLPSALIFSFLLNSLFTFVVD